jgi:4-hydroxy-3-polyprenylbenzoate decarboxylase
MKSLIIGITGASGSIYAKNFIINSLKYGIDLHIVASPMGEVVFAHEMEQSLDDFLQNLSGNFKKYQNNDMFAPIASGSFKTDGMVVIPCSMKTLACISSGLSDSLLQRAADVSLKERRKLILVLRESPLSIIHIRNMLAVSESGAIVLPASPGFYHKPQTIESLADFISGKIFDLLGIEHDLSTSWKGIDKY